MLNDLHLALRSLRKSPGFTTVAVLILALGIGANAAIFSIVNAALLRPLPYPRSDRLVRIYTTTGPHQRGEFSGPDFLDMEQRARSFAAVAATSGTSLTLTGSGEPERLPGEAVSAAFFDVLGVPPFLGRTFAPAGADEPPQAVLSWDLWTTRFGGDPGILGRVLTPNGEGYAVVGVMPRGFQGDQRDTRLWTLQPNDVPGSPFGDRNMEHNRGARYLDVLARLRSGVTVEQAAAELGALAARLGTTYPDTDGGMLLLVRDWHEDLVGDTRLPLMLLLTAVGVVLLIACANIANLLLARGTARQREVTIRSALGASRGRIAQQFLTESAVVSVTGGLAGLGLAYVALGPVKALISSWAGPGIDVRRISIDERVLLFALAASLLAGFLAGVAPALTTGHVELSHGLREGSRGTTESAGRHRLRTAFVVAQVALSLVLLVAAGLLLRSFARLTSTDPGFDPTRVVTIGLPLPPTQYSGARVAQFYQQVLERVRSLPASRRPAPCSTCRSRGTLLEQASWSRVARRRNPARAKRRALSGLQGATSPPCESRCARAGSSTAATDRTHRARSSSTKPWRSGTGRGRIRWTGE